MYIKHRYLSLFLNTMNKIPSFLYNKYVLTLVGLFLWVLILDETDLFRLYKYRQNLKDLQTEKVYLKEEIKSAKESLDALRNDPEEREKFAREHHYMKRENEDVFVFVKSE